MIRIAIGIPSPEQRSVARAAAVGIANHTHLRVQLRTPARIALRKRWSSRRLGNGRTNRRVILSHRPARHRQHRWPLIAPAHQRPQRRDGTGLRSLCAGTQRGLEKQMTHATPRSRADRMWPISTRVEPSAREAVVAGTSWSKISGAAAT
jgi:hypothetical protein